MRRAERLKRWPNLRQVRFFEIGDDPTDVATGWRSYCVPIPGSRLNDRLDVSASGNPAIQIANPRFVPSCDCKRDVQWDTTCGLHGNGASSGCL